MADIRLDLEEADGDLPPVCLCCGEPATVTKTKRMSWCPPWVGVLILGGLLPYLIVVLILTKRATLQAPFCAAHQGHWFNRNLLVWGTFVFLGFLGGGLFALLILIQRPGEDHLMAFGCLGVVVFFVIWVVIVVAAQNTAIRPKEITDSDITLQGVSDAFVDACEEEDRRRRAKRRQRYDWDDDDVDEPPPRKKKRPPSDAIEEDT